MRMFKCGDGGWLDGSGRSDVRYPAKIVLKRKQLMYDIANCSYVQGHLTSEEVLHLKHLVSDIDSEGNVDRVNRVLAMVHAWLVEALYPWTKCDVGSEGVTVDNSLWTPEEYVIEMSVPERFSQTTVHLLSRLAHEYMVCQVMAEWLGLLGHEGAEFWAVKAQGLLEEINRAKNRRSGCMLRRSHPF